MDWNAGGYTQQQGHESAEQCLAQAKRDVGKRVPSSGGGGKRPKRKWWMFWHPKR